MVIILMKIFSVMLMIIYFSILISRYYFRKERQHWRPFLEHHPFFRRVLTGTIMDWYLMVAFLVGTFVFFVFGYKNVAFICEAGFAFIANLLLTNNLDASNLNKVKNKIFLGSIIILSTLQYFVINIYYSVTLLRAADVWLGILVNTILLIFINFIHLWRILNISIKIENLLISGLIGISFIEIISYGSMGVIMINTADWNRVIDCNTLNYFDKFTFLVAVGIDSINQFKPLNELLSTKDILVYCVGNIVNIITAGFFISYITSTTFEIVKSKSNKNTDDIEIKKLNVR